MILVITLFLFIVPSIAIGELPEKISVDRTNTFTSDRLTASNTAVDEIQKNGAGIIPGNVSTSDHAGSSIRLFSKTIDHAAVCTIAVDCNKPIQKVNPLFFGVNVMFYVDDDSSCADGKIAQLLKEMPCRIIRYPGGEVSDNYLWKTHSLDDPDHYPRIQGPHTMDTDEFIAFCRQVGAEPLICVNIENGFLHGNVDTAIQDAADWVNYCNRVRGYNVKYWEISNESSYITTRFPLTAHEYSDAVVKTARAMKAIDPSIQIMACGPNTLHGIAGIEYLPPEKRHWFITLHNDARRQVRETYRNKRETEKAIPPEWWQTLVDNAGSEIDIFDFHYKYGHRTVSYETFTRNSAMTDRATEFPVQLRQFLEAKLPGKEIVLANSEGLLGKRSPDGDVQGMALALIVSELIGKSLAGGVDIGTYWPLRHYTEVSYWRGLIDYESNEPLPAYFVFQMYSSHIGDELLSVQSSNSQVYVCAGKDTKNNRMTIILTNKSLRPEKKPVHIDIEDYQYSEVLGVTLTAPELKSIKASYSDLSVERSGSTLSCVLPPYSVTMIQVAKQ